MSDLRVRSLARGAEGGDAEAAAALLALRFRQGELGEERLRLAAHLGDPAAVSVACQALRVLAPRAQGLGPWVRAVGAPKFKTWGRALPWPPLVQPVCARMSLAAAEAALAVWSSPAWAAELDALDADCGILARVLPDVQAWLADPEAHPAHQLWSRYARERWVGALDEVALELLSVVCQPVAPAARSPHSRELHTARSAAQVVEAAAQALCWAEGSRSAEVSLRERLRAAALPWLLG